MDKLRRTRAYQPVLTDIRNIASTGWYGSPQNATKAKGQDMIEAIAKAIAKESSEIFQQLDGVKGGVAEVAGLSPR
jgi:creatinine amidohydrolase